MYHQVYFHRTAVAASAMLTALSRLLPRFRLPAGPQFLQWDDAALGAGLLEEAQASLVARELALDLFRRRRLWKCLAEDNLPHGSPGGETQGLQLRLESQGCLHEVVVTRRAPGSAQPQTKGEIYLVHKGRAGHPPLTILPWGERPSQGGLTRR